MRFDKFKTYARIVRYVRRDDGAALGALLRSALPPREQRRAGATMLADSSIVFGFSGGGFDWEVPAGDLITVGMVADGNWREDQTLAVSGWLRAQGYGGGHVLEVGAHIGSTTLVLARESWTVIAIEPVPSNREFLDRNLAANGLADKVMVLECAIERPGTVDMMVPRSHGGSRVTEHGDITVEADTLDELADRHGPIAFVWGAADRSELLTLRSGEGLWQRGVPLYLKLLPQHDDVIATAIRERFGVFVGVEELLSQRESAPLMPTSALANYLTDRPRYTDLLLLQRGHEL